MPCTNHCSQYLEYSSGPDGQSSCLRTACAPVEKKLLINTQINEQENERPHKCSAKNTTK